MIVVLFKNRLRDGRGGPDYDALALRMWEIVSEMPGFVSLDSFATPDGGELAIVKFESEASLEAWRQHPEHREAQRRGRDFFYDSYQVQVCTVTREYGFDRANGDDGATHGASEPSASA